MILLQYACALMSYWAGLFMDEDRVALEAGINTMLQIGLRLVKKRKPESGDQNLLPEPDAGNNVP
jgi:hypothetical protein